MWFNPDADLDARNVQWLTTDIPSIEATNVPEGYYNPDDLPFTYHIPSSPINTTDAINIPNPFELIQRGFQTMYDILAVFGTAGMLVLAFLITFILGGLVANYTDNRNRVSHRAR